MASLESIFNHLVLPPKLPEQEDPDIEEIAASVAARLTQATDTLASFGGEHAATWNSIGQSLRICRQLNAGRLDKSSLLHEFRNLDPDVPIILYVVEQNAAVIIRQQTRYAFRCCRWQGKEGPQANSA